MTVDGERLCREDTSDRRWGEGPDEVVLHGPKPPTRVPERYKVYNVTVQDPGTDPEATID